MSRVDSTPRTAAGATPTRVAGTQNAADRFLQQAMAFRGQPYRWGGGHGWGYDRCWRDERCGWSQRDQGRLRCRWWGRW